MYTNAEGNKSYYIYFRAFARRSSPSCVNSWTNHRTHHGSPMTRHGKIWPRFYDNISASRLDWGQFFNEVLHESRRAAKSGTKTGNLYRNRTGTRFSGAHRSNERRVRDAQLLFSRCHYFIIRCSFLFIARWATGSNARLFIKLAAKNGQRGYERNEGGSQIARMNAWAAPRNGIVSIADPQNVTNDPNKNDWESVRCVCLGLLMELRSAVT